MDTDNNKSLNKDELLEASKVSDDIRDISYSPQQMEKMVDGLIGIGDQNGDRKINFDEYVQMSLDFFINKMGPSWRRVLRN